MTSYDLDKYFPLQGICYHCGRDLRQHTMEDISARFSAGDAVEKIASDFRVPAQAIQFVLNKDSTKPLGRTIAPLVRAASA